MRGAVDGSGWLILAAACVLGCGARTTLEPGGPDAGGGCVPGRQLACACLGDRVAVQVCGDDGVFEPCQCDRAVSRSGSAPSPGDDPTPGEQSANPPASPEAAAPDRTPASPTPTREPALPDSEATAAESDESSSEPVSTSGPWFEAPDTIVDLFVAEFGTLLVSASSVTLLDDAGSEVQRVDSSREITAAAQLGSTLVVADRARFIVYDQDLEETASGDLLEECASAVLIEPDRFVCGPGNDWDRIFYTYSTSDGQLLASSMPFTYNGIPMRRVPGEQAFVTVTTGLSPSDFHAYRLLDTSEAEYLNESPYHGDFHVTFVFAFWGDPATHLVNDEGLLLELNLDGCGGDSSFESDCFVKDGSLGTLTGAQRFAAMDSDAERVYAIVSPEAASYRAESSESGRLLQKVLVADRVIETQRILTEALGEPSVVRHDSYSDSLVVGEAGSEPRVWRLPYE